jgi:ABC-type multidrug transport system permease subunit
VTAGLEAVWAGALAEARQLTRSPLLLALTIVQALSFLLLVSLFGLTGSRAPVALIDRDGGAYARHFIGDLQRAHHSFDLRPMSDSQANAALAQGHLVASITIPRGFSKAITRVQTVPIRVVVDNVDMDLTEDIQRALPAAIVAFAQEERLPGIRLHPAELDLVNHDTGFIPYLVISGLALDALIVAGILGGVAVAREFESRTVSWLAVSPVHPLLPLSGRLLATGVVAMVAMLLTAVLVVAGYGIVPVHPIEMILGLLVCVVIFGCVGAALGAALRRTLPLASLVFGLSLPLYMDSGALEPERFDGDPIWILAHLSPVYYAVGVLENAAHGLQVTPEPVLVDFLALAGWAVLALALAGAMVRRRIAP